MVDGLNYNADKVLAGHGCVYENGTLIEVNGKKLAKGYTPKAKGQSGSRKDETRDKIKSIVNDCLKAHVIFGKNIFQHSAEGLIVRLPDSDYSVRVSHNKEVKFDGEDVEKNFVVRGKGPNATPAIAKALCAKFDELAIQIVDAKASAITLHTHENEYTVKISKKRERVGFEAERPEVYIQ